MELDHPSSPVLDWTNLRVGGTRGVITIVFSLGLCYPRFAQGGGMNEAQWHRWVFDVVWVYKHLLATQYVR